MKIVVIGGSGLIGSKLVEKLGRAGHDPLAASPDSGVDTLTGEGLAEALEAARVVVDVSNAPAWSDEAVMEFFQTSTRNILAGEVAAGVRPPRGAFGRRHRPAAGERVLPGEARSGGSDQGGDRALHDRPRDAVLRVPRPHRRREHRRRNRRLPPVLVQPEAADDVAAALAVAAVGAPVNGTSSWPVPNGSVLDELTRRVLSANGDPRRVMADADARYFGAELDDSPSSLATTHGSLRPVSRTGWTGAWSSRRGPRRPKLEGRLYMKPTIVESATRARQRRTSSTASSTPISEHELERRASECDQIISSDTRRSRGVPRARRQ